MKLPSRQNALLAIVMGVVDGILTVLILATGAVVNESHHHILTLDLSLRVATGAFFSAAFVYFVARYSSLRDELLHAEKELLLAKHGRLAVTKLGRSVLHEAILDATLSSIAAFVGAFWPLGMSVLLPDYRWSSILASLIALFLLGLALAKVLYGSLLRWSISLLLGGALLALVGAKLAILD